ncbi:MerR family transcriptional regulator [Micromonospora tulbaghiae]|uniref:MerR family transcriptional regulator n=1 Tax=Micromonospora tulbaghiae TaxID=479978 RepID=UPI0013C40A16|nr:MerR family transcriptional regulator [Micromonospora tulbaghiae]
MDISELARRAGVKPSALRYYEREGLLTPAGRSNGRRLFDDNGLMQLAAIDFWRDAGFSIKKIAELLADMSISMNVVKKIASGRIAELEQTITHAEHVKGLLSNVMACDHRQLNECPHYRSILKERVDSILLGGYQGFGSRRH